MNRKKISLLLALTMLVVSLLVDVVRTLQKIATLRMELLKRKAMFLISAPNLMMGN